MKKKKKKTNKSRRIPVSMEYAERRYRQGVDFGLYAAWVIMFSCMAEDLEFDQENLQFIFNKCNEKADSIRKGYCDVEDWAQILEQEHDIKIKKAVLHKDG